MKTGQRIVISDYFILLFLIFYFFAASLAAENPISERLQQKRRSQTGALRRVLLTTQIQVRQQMQIFSDLSPQQPAFHQSSQLKETLLE